MIDERSDDLKDMQWILIQMFFDRLAIDLIEDDEHWQDNQETFFRSFYAMWGLMNYEGKKFMVRLLNERKNMFTPEEVH